MTPEEKNRHRKMRRNINYPTFFSGRTVSTTTSFKTDIKNDFTTGNDQYPRNCQATLHFLDKYSKSEIVIQPTSEGAAFSWKGGNRDQGGDKNTYDKSTGRQKSASSVARKITQLLIFQNAVRKTTTQTYI